MTKEKKKLTTAEIIMIVFCSLGLLLMVAQNFIETELNLFSIALALNGIGIFAFLFSQKSKKTH